MKDSDVGVPLFHKQSIMTKMYLAQSGTAKLKFYVLAKSQLPFKLFWDGVHFFLDLVKSTKTLGNFLNGM